jgi:hypothetical protein
MYEQGRGVEQSDVEAFRWYTVASNAGCASSMFCLSFLHHEGRGGVPQNSERAFELLMQAAAAGSEPAIELLSEFQPSEGFPVGLGDFVAASLQLQIPPLPGPECLGDSTPDIRLSRHFRLPSIDRGPECLERPLQQKEAPKKKLSKEGRPAWR